MPESLTLNNTLTAIAELVQIVEEDGKGPVSIAVCDRDGFNIVFIRMDGAPLRSMNLAVAKAYTSSRMGTTTQAFYERLRREDLDLSFFCDSKLTAFLGGAPVFNKDILIGAVGISGRQPAEDQKLSILLVELIAKCAE